MTPAEREAFLADVHVGILGVDEPRRAGRFSLGAQSEALPYRYVSVEGPVTVVEDTVDADERRRRRRRRRRRHRPSPPRP
jgi:hypothetical protein